MQSHDLGWGLYPWFEELGAQYIHPDDLEAIRLLAPYGNVFRCVGKVDDMIVLSYGNKQFRVRPSLFQPVPSLKFNIGDRVSFESKGIRKEGTVERIGWHSKESRPFFHLSCNGKKVSKRYWSEDLSPV